MKHFKRSLFTYSLIILALGGPLTMTSPAEGQTKAKQPERFVSIDFNNVDINVFIKFISELTGTNFVVDDRVKGKVTILSPSKISVEEAYRVFESVLEVHGYTTIKSGKIIKVVPSPDARSKSIETLLRQEAGTPEDRVVTQLIPLRYADANEIKRLFAPLVSKSSVILAYPPTNMLIVTDVYSNILRLLHILTAIDVTGIGQELSLIPIENADALKLVKLLDAIFKKAQRAKKGDPTPALRFVADERTNTIIVLASEDETVRIKSLITMLDQEVPKGEGKIHVYYLENAVAEDLAKVLQSLSGKTAKAAPGGKKGAPVVSDQVQITADKATNSLIISAAVGDYTTLEAIIKKLDIPRSMVYIEALIMEVATTKDFDVGTEWRMATGATVGDKNAVVGSQFTFDDSNVGEFEDGILALPVGGFAMGIFSEAVTISGIQFSNIQAIIHAFKRDKDVSILSTPQILTTDNEEAKITVGKNLPFQAQATTTNNDTFNSFEYRDVGKTLTITPQISKDRMVRLKISLQITALESTVEFRPTTLKRTIDTTAIVEDTGTIVLGGLIEENSAVARQEVPCLGEIPLYKYLFGTTGTCRDQTNLYVFLTPHVINTQSEAEDVYKRKREHIDNVLEGSIKMYKKHGGK